MYTKYSHNVVGLLQKWDVPLYNNEGVLLAKIHLVAKYCWPKVAPELSCTFLLLHWL